MCALLRCKWLWIGLVPVCLLVIVFWARAGAKPDLEELDRSLPERSGKPRVVFGHTRSSDQPPKNASEDDDL
jgi:hypothetical protein